MPITRKQFEIGIDPKIEEWMGKIHGFLSKRKDEAFSREELWEGLCGKSEESKEWDAALGKLVELGRAEKRIIRGMDYYSCKEAKKWQTSRSNRF